MRNRQSVSRTLSAGRVPFGSGYFDDRLDGAEIDPVVVSLSKQTVTVLFAIQKTGRTWLRHLMSSDMKERHNDNK
jgi:hypothetical protein